MARDFAAGSDNLSVSDDVTMRFGATDDYSICVLVNHDGLSSFQLYSVRQTGTGSNLLQIRKSDDHTFQIVAGTVSFDLFTPKSTATLSTGTWYCLVVTRKGSATKTIKLYVTEIGDVATEDSSHTDTPTTGHGTVLTNTRIGSFIDSSLNTDGQIAMIGYWKDAILTLEEVKSLAKGVNASLIRRDKQVGLLNLVGFSPELDLSGTGNTAAVTGTTLAAHAPVEPLENYL